MMVSVVDALEITLRDIRPLPPEKVSILEARTRVLAEDVEAPRDLPPRDNSAMDGYACKYSDLGRSGWLCVVEIIPAGSESARLLRAGEAMKIMTGAPVPEGADTVVPVEGARVDGDRVELAQSAGEGANIRLAGEDVRSGDLVLPRGTLVRPAEVGMLASLGRSFVLVHQRPRVAILATGNEIVDVDGPRNGGEIVDANSYGIAAQVAEAGGVPVCLGIGPDDPDGLAEMLGRAATADVIITTGGVSVGDFDHMLSVFANSGVELQFAKVAMKPGKPLVFGMKGSTPVFGLPGNPVAAMVGFEQFCRPTLKRLQGHVRLFRSVSEAILGEEAGSVRSKAGRTEFLRCRLVRGEKGLRVVNVGKSGSGLLSTLVEANAFLILGEETTGAEPGARVQVQVYERDFLEQVQPGFPGVEWVP